MPRFLATLRAAAADAGKRPLPSEQSAAFMQAWAAWAQRHAAALVDGGAPVAGTRRVTAAGIAEGRNDIVAYCIVEAPSLAAAARLFEDHPHLGLGAANAIEVSELLAIPG